MAKDLSVIEAAEKEIADLLSDDGFLSWGEEATETEKPTKATTAKTHNTTIISGLKDAASGTLPKKRGRPVGTTKAALVEAAEKSGRGRPKSRTLDFARVPTVEEKIVLVKDAIVTAYSSDFLKYLTDGKHIEFVIVRNDGKSVCDRVRVYIGQEHGGCHARSMAKGRGRCTERKGVYPIAKLVVDILGNYHNEWKK